MATVSNGVDIEREELNWLLSSGTFGRSHNLTQMLAYVCEKHFEGLADQITEQSIAVEALGRRKNFNPQTDTIVRVTTHLLRKRLQEFYTGEGAVRPVHILIPQGTYTPSFVRQDRAAANVSPLNIGIESASSASRRPVASHSAPRRRWLVLGLLPVAVFLIVITLFHTRHPQAHPISTTGPIVKTFDVIAGHAIRALLGAGRKSYVDHSGYTWTPGNYCIGGSSITEANQQIAGTEDPTIFLGGVRGSSHCTFRVDPGIYEVHLLFAEASKLEMATSRAVYSLNGGDNETLDIVNDAGGDYIATTKVISGVKPESDSTIHIDFVSEVSLLKAVEILPAASEAMLPLRIVAGPRSFKDRDGHVWLSDRYYLGGRPGRGAKLYKIDENGLYSSRRIGSFRYVLPVIPLQGYRVNLYFQEPWFGTQNTGIGGSHSRVFDIWCNGATLLKDFDIYSEAGTHPIVKTFDNIQATSEGKIELTFTPVINYPLVSAIEVLPEPSRQ